MRVIKNIPWLYQNSTHNASDCAKTALIIVPIQCLWNCKSSAYDSATTVLMKGQNKMLFFIVAKQCLP
jgi:hypothetical protein